MFPLTMLKAYHPSLSKSSPHISHASFTFRTSHQLLEHVISISWLASSAGAAPGVQTYSSLFLILPA